MIEQSDILSIHELLKDKKVSSRELTQEAIKNAKTSKTNAFISLTEEVALGSAQNSDDLIAKDGFKSLLQGVPYTLKDLFVTKGLRTTAGSRILFNYIPPYDGYVAEKLKASGAILIGKVSCDEFGMGSTNENTPFGAVLNPIDHLKVQGGSSGGSAASVAEGS